MPHTDPLAFQPGEVIVHAGQPATHFHIILSGTATRFLAGADVNAMATIDEETSFEELKKIDILERVDDIHPGQSFGEVGLMKGLPRIYTVRAKTSVRAVRLSRAAFRTLLADSDLMDHELGVILQQRLMQAALATALPSLDPTEVIARAPEFELQHYAAGEVIILQGDPADRFFVIASGKVDVTHRAADGQHRHLNTLHPGGAFGEIGILQRRPRMATVKATTDGPVTVMTLDRAAFEKIVARSPAAMVDLSMVMCRRLMEGVHALVE